MFRKPDSNFKRISAYEDTIDLEMEPGCRDAYVLYAQGNISGYMDKVDQLSEVLNCYCSENVRAARKIGSMENIQDLNRAAMFLERVFRNCPTESNDPNLYLIALRVYHEKMDFEMGENAYLEFQRRTHLIREDVRKSIVCQADYLYGQLLYRKYTDYGKRLGDPRLSDDARRRLESERDNVRTELRDHIEYFQSRNPTCGSLQPLLSHL